MDKTEYRAMKKLAVNQLGAEDAESLNFFASKLEKQSNMYKWLSIFLVIIGIPLCAIMIGFPLIIVGLITYFFIYKKMFKKAQYFKEHVKNDPEFTSAFAI